MPLPHAILLITASLAAGFVNAIAGGGSLLSFPALLAIGVPPLIANVTNTLALTPGYLGASQGQWRDLHDQGGRLRRLLPAAVLGGLAGALLLLGSDAAVFSRLVPWLLLSGSALLALQEPLRRALLARVAERPVPPPPLLQVPQPAADAAAMAPASPPLSPGWLLSAAVLVAAVYGGYFGAGLSVILLAVLACGLPDSLCRLNGLKQPLSLACNLAAALVFAGSGPVRWPLVALMAAGAWLGGLLGGRWASRLNPVLLRRLVVATGFLLALVALLRR